MKVTGLRIGNYITGLYEDLEGNEATALCKIVALDSVGVTDNTFWVESKDTDIEKYDGFEGEKITSEKLKHFGFEVEEREGLIIASNDSFNKFEIISINGETFKLSKYNNGFKHMKYMHEVQNIYFALQGKELEYKPL
ncbi:hypothetical protein [Seonamhaeicola sp.]|uniref:hypothetical protein n=1 Tax=Seonamhaeicola sp. TaxID=1912245 RepID=UPI0035645675